MCYIIAMLFDISKEDKTSPTLITSDSSCQPDVKQRLSSCFFMIGDRPFGYCYLRLLVDTHRDYGCLGCLYQPLETRAFSQWSCEGHVTML